MANQSFQQSVNTYPAIARPGTFASLNPHYFYPVVPLAGADGVTLGLGCFYDSTDNTVSNTGTTDFIGFAVAEMAYANYDMRDSYSYKVAEGEAITVLQRGDLYVAIGDDTPAFGNNVYITSTTGALVFDAATTPPTGTVATGFKVVSFESGNNVALISNQG